MLSSSSSSSLLLSTALPAINASGAVNEAAATTTTPDFAELLSNLSAQAGGKLQPDTMPGEAPAPAAGAPAQAASLAQAATATGKILPPAGKFLPPFALEAERGAECGREAQSLDEFEIIHLVQLMRGTSLASAASAAIRGGRPTACSGPSSYCYCSCGSSASR